MKVFDRFAGMETDLPPRVEPGRYQLLAATRLNRSIDLQAGEVLWSDGSARCLLSSGATEDSLHDFLQPPPESDGQAPDSLIDEAIGAVVKLWREWQSDPADQPLTSPVMPAQLGHLAELNRLETQLEKTLAAGHLQTIAQRPRMDMRYDTELLPVSRARRVASGAQVRLAAHSEDWAQREITGVVPSRLLAEVSEDELAIYENRVFARLLDRLAQLLRHRIRELLALLAKREEAASLSDAERLDYRLRNALCQLWGRAFDADETQSAQQVLQTLQRQLGKVRQMQRSPVAQVASLGFTGLTLRNTNILQHDPHYRHLRPLWRLAHAGLENVARTPAERFEQSRQAGEAHSEQVGLLIRHALGAIRRHHPSPLMPSRDGLDWLVEASLPGVSIPRLRFVPARRGKQPWCLAPESIGGEERHIVFSHADGDKAEQPGADAVLNPLEFYGVERVQQVIEHWLMRHLLQGYPFVVRQVPDALRVAFGRLAQSAWAVQGRDLALRRPLTPTERGATLNAVATCACNDRTRQGLQAAIDRMDLLARCRVCGAESTEWEVSDRAFRATCRGCGNKVTWQQRGGSVVYCSGETDRPFEEVGHLAMGW